MIFREQEKHCIVSAIFLISLNGTSLLNNGKLLFPDNILSTDFKRLLYFWVGFFGFFFVINIMTVLWILPNVLLFTVLMPDLRLLLLPFLTH